MIAGETVKAIPFEVFPPTVAVTFPVVAELGTTQVIEVELHVDGVQVLPLNATVLDP